MQALRFRDCLPYDGALTSADEVWLATARDVVRPDALAVRLSDVDLEAEPVVYRDADGRWRAGRYVGHVTVENRRLIIEPRLGLPIIETWLNDALGLLAVPGSATTTESDAFIARLLARIWCAGLDRAARHGLPAFRADRLHEGQYARGRLAVRETVALRNRGLPHLATVTRDRIIANPVSEVIVAASRYLSQQIGHQRWQTMRVREVLPQLVAEVGSRPRLPRVNELRTVRYTPITEPYRQVAQLSYRIARAGGLAATDDAGAADGLLIDVAELWELFVLACARDAFAPYLVEHGTQVQEPDALLVSVQDPTKTLGRIRPDILARDTMGIVQVILDAKYKRLQPSRDRPWGIDRDDLYQLASYFARYEHDGLRGGLVYPHDTTTEVGAPAMAERDGPWTTQGGSRVWFARLPVTPVECRGHLREMLWATS